MRGLVALAALAGCQFSVSAELLDGGPGGQDATTPTVRSGHWQVE